MQLAAAGDLDRSRKFFLEALDLARSSGDLGLAGLVLQNLGNQQRDQGNLDGAMGYLVEAKEVLENSGGNPLTLAVLLSNIADIHRHKGNQKAATEALIRCIEISRELNSPPVLGQHVLNLAELAYTSQHVEMAARLLSCAKEIWKSSKLKPSPEAAQSSEELGANLREEMKPTDLADALNTGKGMNNAEIAEYALKAAWVILDACG